MRCLCNAGDEAIDIPLSKAKNSERAAEDPTYDRVQTHGSRITLAVEHGEIVHNTGSVAKLG
jgi:hypothetical protein